MGLPLGAYEFAPGIDAAAGEAKGTDEIPNDGRTRGDRRRVSAIAPREDRYRVGKGAETLRKLGETLRKGAETQAAAFETRSARTEPFREWAEGLEIRRLCLCAEI
jgi:hypothetical protein